MLLKTIISGNTAWAEKPAYTRNLKTKKNVHMVKLVSALL